MRDRLDGMVEALSSLEDSAYDGDAHVILMSLLTGLNVDGYIFSSISLKPDGQAASYQFLIGCNPEWMQIYQHRHWYSNDPYLEYSRSNTKPATGSSFSQLSAGQPR